MIRRSKTGSRGYIELTNGDEFKRTLKKLLRKNRKAVARVMNEEAHAIWERSQILVPVRTGRLKGSGRVEKATSVGKKYISAGVVYTAPYATYVHESTEILHTPPTRSKYLEAAMKDSETTMQTRLLQELRDTKHTTWRNKKLI
tara:strand:+ start:3511 stop:3942 length:432 start_codon:yes stop_codon:yes gene_type:complete